MTDKEIIEKLKTSSNPDNIGCSPTHGLCGEALNLIERQKKVIDGFTMIGKLYSEIKAEAVKEFAKELMYNLDGDIEAYANAGHSLNVYAWLKGYLVCKGAIKAETEFFGISEQLKGETNDTE